MSLYVPYDLPAIGTVRAEGLPVFGGTPKGIKPLRILLLNLMPIKETTELDFIRMLALEEEDVELILMKISGQTYKHTSEQHMNAFYKDFESLRDEYFDGFIVTGTPVEHLSFEEVRYWKQLEEIFEWVRSNVRSSLYICWGSQAGLYHFYDIPKYSIPQKMFGVFEQKILKKEEALFTGMGDSFYMPQSRHTEIRRADLDKFKDLTILAESPESGVGIAQTRQREFFITGHLEYAVDTLNNEYVRDLGLGLPIQMPKNYYPDNDATHTPSFSWDKGALLFYHNWIKYYVHP